jgi:hypothetical protein
MNDLEASFLEGRSATSQPTSSEVRLHRQTPNYLPHAHDVPFARRIEQRFLRPVRSPISEHERENVQLLAQSSTATKPAMARMVRRA